MRKRCKLSISCHENRWNSFSLFHDLPSRLSEKRQEELLALIATCITNVKQNNGKLAATKNEIMENGDASAMLQEQQEQDDDVVVKTEPS